MVGGGGVYHSLSEKRKKLANDVTTDGRLRQDLLDYDCDFGISALR